MDRVSDRCNIGQGGSRGVVVWVYGVACVQEKKNHVFACGFLGVVSDFFDHGHGPQWSTVLEGVFCWVGEPGTSCVGTYGKKNKQ